MAAALLLLAGSGAAHALDCIIQPHQVVQVGSPVAGVVASVAVERGDVVQRGQVLVRLRADVERANLELAHERAGARGELSATQGARELALRELERARELHGEQFVSRTFVERAQAEAAVSGGRTEQALERRRLAEREVALAQAQLAQRTIRSPIDGVVVDRYLGPGEFVEQRPLLRIAAVDPLRVDVLVPAAAFGRVKVGAQARVEPELFDRRSHTAVVTGVDRVIDAASNTFRVRLDLPNPDGALPPGLRCQIDLGVEGLSRASGRGLTPVGLVPGAAPAPALPATATGPARPAAAR